ncbi:MAG TPA: class I SAM-dependent rRNA methyltransferase [Pyrinomonadaceae bacterium]|nr:class I SAM-dependent rRNA methyltransferase [Pyrinomonadaceae bacterium]
MNPAQVTISRRGAERARAGHLWIYRGDVRDARSAEPGAVVSVVDERGRAWGAALYSARSEIALRLLATSGEAVDREWWRARIRTAARRRAGVETEADAYRLVYSEGDLLPSLIVDRYADVLVVQTLSQGTEALKALLVELLVEEFAPRSVVERNDVRVRALEGLEQRAGVVYGEDPGEFEVRQHGVRFLVAPLGGQKTGAFLDQRENHAAARSLARGRALDCFTFGGGFALNIAPACESVVAIDISSEAVAAARRNAELNGASHVEVREANVFDALREMEAAGERFQTVVLDPPAFAKNRASVEAAARGYKEINLRALKLLDAGGVLVTCTCSYHMSEGMFLEVLSAASADARRRVQLVERRTQSHDHPVLVGVPETLYLKCVVARVID